MTLLSTKFSLFELMTGVKVHSKDNFKIKRLLESVYMQPVVINKSTLCNIAKSNILKHQEFSRCQHNKIAMFIIFIVIIIIIALLSLLFSLH